MPPGEVKLTRPCGPLELRAPRDRITKTNPPMLFLFLFLFLSCSEISNLKFQISDAVAFAVVGALACCSRPCNARENVAYLSPRNAIQKSPRSITAVVAPKANKADAARKGSPAGRAQAAASAFKVAALSFMRGKERFSAPEKTRLVSMRFSAGHQQRRLRCNVHPMQLLNFHSSPTLLFAA